MQYRTNSSLHDLDMANQRVSFLPLTDSILKHLFQSFYVPSILVSMRPVKNAFFKINAHTQDLLVISLLTNDHFSA